MSARKASLCLVLAGCMPLASQAEEVPAVAAQMETGAAAFLERCERWDKWDKPAPPYQISGNSWYVGTCGISAILVTGDDGHILIDSGVESAAPLVLENIRALGFEPTDVGYLLMSHEHFDHVAGHAAIARATGAEVVASAEAKPVLESGLVAADDPQADAGHPAMIPVGVDRVVAHGDTITLGAITIMAHATPGHTPGALSWTWTSCGDPGESTSCRDLAYVDSLSAVSGDSYRFTDNPETIADFHASMATVAAMPCDELLTPHPSSSSMIERLRGGIVGDGNQCKAYAQQIGQSLDKRLEREAGG